MGCYKHNSLCAWAVIEMFLPEHWQTSINDCGMIPEPFKRIFYEGVILYSNFQVLLSCDWKWEGTYSKTSLKIRAEKELTGVWSALAIFSDGLTFTWRSYLVISLMTSW